MNVELNFEKRYRLVREIIETIVLTLLMFLVINLAVQNFDVDGHSMEPNLHDQERLMVDKWTYMFHPPARGDVVVFVAPPQPTLDYVKRIVAVPGDTLTIHNTTVIVDGVTLNETYVKPANQGNPFAEKRIENMVIPPGNYFVLGDNRANSSDSRDWGLLWHRITMASFPTSRRSLRTSTSRTAERRRSSKARLMASFMPIPLCLGYYPC